MEEDFEAMKIGQGLREDMKSVKIVKNTVDDDVKLMVMQIAPTASRRP
ncbi:MAG: hypothetical protein QXG32_06115 [Candidatus Bathyarchaeia archaeon]